MMCILYICKTFYKIDLRGKLNLCQGAGKNNLEGHFVDFPIL